MKLLKNILIKFIWVILILMVAFNVYNFVSINLLHKDLAAVNGYALLEVISGSMEPTLHVGDLIIIDTNWKNYEKGDIITFRDVNEAFVTHRINKISNGKMITQGDANESEDEEMSTSSIVGKCVSRVPGGGKLIASFKSPVVMLLILVIGIVCCALASTDNNMVPKDLTDEEKEFLEYKKNKNIMAAGVNDSLLEESPTHEIRLVKDDKKVKTAKKSTTTKKTSTAESTKKKVSTKAKEEKESTPKKTSQALKKNTANTKKTTSSSTTKSTTKSGSKASTPKKAAVPKASAAKTSKDTSKPKTTRTTKSTKDSSDAKPKTSSKTTKSTTSSRTTKSKTVK